MLRTIQASFTGGELAPSLHSRVDLSKYAEGLKTCRNFLVAAHGGAYSRPGLRFVAEARDSTHAVRLIPFEFSSAQTYVLEFGHMSMRVHQNGGPVLETAKAATANGAVLTAAAHGWAVGDDLYLTGVSGGQGRTVRITAITADTATVTPLDGAVLALSGSGTAARVYTLGTPYTSEQIFRLNVVQSADVMTMCHPDHPPRDLKRFGHASWTLTDVSFVPAQAPVTGLTVTAQKVGTSGFSYAVTAVNQDSGEESLPVYQSLATGLEKEWKNALAWAAVAGAGSYIVYRRKGGVYGFVGRAESTSFTDDNIAPLLSDTPPAAREPFGPGNYPRTVTYYQQRRVYAGSRTKPQTLWFSQSAAYSNFSVASPAKDDDAITLTLAAQRVNEVRHLVPLTSLIALTSGGEWTIGAGNASEPVTPSTVMARPQGYRGASPVAPLVVGNTVLYVQAQGASVRDLGYDFTSDSFTGNDLSVLSNHLFSRRQIVDWAYGQVPYSIVWAVRDDGVLLGLTYMREHKVWGWHHHETDGVFESVASVPEGNEDGVYVVVRRTLNGVSRRCIERFSGRAFTTVEEAFCVDCGLSYSGAAVSVISGLWHLEGREVVVLADGNVVNGLTVTGGRITLPNPASQVHVGLPYTCDLRTLNLEMAQVGTLQGRDKRVVAVTVRMEATRGLKVGTDTALTEMRIDPAGPVNPAPLETGDYTFALPPGWSKGSEILLRQDAPLPAAVMAVIPEIDVA